MFSERPSRRGRPARVALVALAAAMVAAACGGGNDLADVTPAPPPTSAATTVATTTVTATTTATTTGTTSSTTSTPSTTSTLALPGGARPDRVTWRGSTSFLLGVNVAWVTWPSGPGHGDFGGGRTDGVLANVATLSERFARVRATGTQVVRWWTFPDTAWQIGRDGKERPTSLDPVVYADFDAAVSLAESLDLYLVFVLFSGPRALPASWRRDADHLDALANALGPLFARYADNPRVMGWEIMNEPEWEIWNSVGVISEADMHAFVKTITASVRLNAPKALVTVGSALVAGFNSGQRSIATWLDIGLDFYSPHWYDPQTAPQVCALCMTARDLQGAYQTTTPIVIGEFNLGLPTTAANLERLNQWYEKGYAGAWAWSLFPEYTEDKIPIDLAALAAFNAQHPGIGPKPLG